MGSGNTTRQLTLSSPPKESPGWDCLLGVHLLIIHFEFQIFKPIKSLTFQIFLNLTYTKRKHLFPKMLKNHPQIYTKPPNSG